MILNHWYTWWYFIHHFLCIIDCIFCSFTQVEVSWTQELEVCTIWQLVWPPGDEFYNLSHCAHPLVFSDGPTSKGEDVDSGLALPQCFLQAMRAERARRCSSQLWDYLEGGQHSELVPSAKFLLASSIFIFCNSFSGNKFLSLWPYPTYFLKIN